MILYLQYSQILVKHTGRLNIAPLRSIKLKPANGLYRFSNNRTETNKTAFLKSWVVWGAF